MMLGGVVPPGNFRVRLPNGSGINDVDAIGAAARRHDASHFTHQNEHSVCVRKPRCSSRF
jgi:hypothetical protein